MIQTIRKAWGIPELRKKIVFTLLILLIFRLGNAIMVPYINRDALALQMQVWGTGLLGLYNVMSGHRVCLEHPALYQQFYYHPVADCGHPRSGAAGP